MEWHILKVVVIYLKWEMEVIWKPPVQIKVIVII